MTCDDLSQRLPEYWAGELTPDARRDVEAHLASCEACRAEAETLGPLWDALGGLRSSEPSPALAVRFEEALTLASASRASGDDRVERAGSRPSPAAAVRHWALRPAWGVAAALLIAMAGFLAGRSWPDASRQAEIAEMRGELKGMRQLVALSLLQQDSAADRLRGVTWSAGIDRPGGEVVSALLETLQHDANVNVRLAAIDALRGLGGAEPRVRDALVGGLKNDPSPLVQVALIDALVTLRERKSADVLRTIAESPTANEAVRQRARRGLEQLL